MRDERELVSAVVTILFVQDEKYEPTTPFASRTAGQPSQSKLAHNTTPSNDPAAPRCSRVYRHFVVPVCTVPVHDIQTTGHLVLDVSRQHDESVRVTRASHQPHNIQSAVHMRSAVSTSNVYARSRTALSAIVDSCQRRRHCSGMPKQQLPNIRCIMPGCNVHPTLSISVAASRFRPIFAASTQSRCRQSEQNDANESTEKSCFELTR